jgi:adenylate kinase family enzyme
VSHGTVEDLRGAARVLLYGVTGSGKSTAAALVGEALGLPVHLVDEEIGWLPGWVERPLEEQRALAGGLVAQEEWVLDSAYGKWSDLVLPRVQVVVALDYPRWLSLARLVRRTAVRFVRRTEVCNGNRESLRAILARDSIIVWHFRSFARKRSRLRAWEGQPDGIPVIRLAHPRELDRLLAALPETVDRQT